MHFRRSIKWVHWQGSFFRARAIGGSLWGSGEASQEDVSMANRVLSFMRSQEDRIRDDPRCLRYFLRALWIVTTRNYLFGGERSPLPDEVEICEILTFLDTLGILDGALGDPRMQYLRAVLMWRLRREHAAREAWNLLSRETAFSDPRRVIRHHVWTEIGRQTKTISRPSNSRRPWVRSRARSGRGTPSGG